MAGRPRRPRAPGTRTDESAEDGFDADDDRRPTGAGPQGTQRVLKKIPEQVIRDAVGLAIFTTMRTGLWVSGAGGSGVLIARKENGEWSPPSGILLHTAGLGFLVGVDIYDCVVVINNRKALDAFTKVRATLGGEISAVAGPVGVGGLLENDGMWKQAKYAPRLSADLPCVALTVDSRPVFTYLKSRGFYAGVQLDGTVVIERNDENERFYGQKIGVAAILAGQVRHPPFELKMLMETVKAAEGRRDVDRALMEELEGQPAPGDVNVDEPGSRTPVTPVFGLPEPDDPDPYGVLALEAEGFEIREAGSQSRPPSTQFEFNPSPTSPMYPRYHRLSLDTLTTNRSNRESYMSSRSYRTRTSCDKAVQTSEMATQTDDRLSPNTSPSRSDQSKLIIEEEEKPAMIEPEEVDYTKVDLSSLRRLNQSDEFSGTTVNNDSPRGRSSTERRTLSIDTTNVNLQIDNTTDEEDEYEEEEPVILEAASAHAQLITPQAIKARGGLVNIPKRPPPPPLPARNRARKGMVDQASGRSPLIISDAVKDAFEEVESHGVKRGSHEWARESLDNARKGVEVEREKSVELEPTTPIPAIETPIVLEDLERTETRETPMTETPFSGSFESRVAHELEIEHMDGITPATTRSDAVEIKREESKEESDDFHSAPTTPLESVEAQAATTVA